jgi:putative sterol carrier protein
MLNDFGGKQRLFLSISVAAVTVCVSPASTAAAENLDSTPQKVFDSMRGSFQAAKATGVHARYQWYLSGPNGGQWWVEVANGRYKIGKGQIANPNVIFVAKAKDWVAISNGQLSGSWAYLTGRLKIRGNQAVARKLGEIFP